MNHTYSSLIPTDHHAPYMIYPAHSTTYPEYSASKLEAFDYNPWPPATHNLLAHPSNVLLDQIPNSSPISETFVPTSSSANFSHLNSNTIPATHHHHHHIHQHLYPPSSSSPTCNESSPWLTSNDYPSFDSTGNASSYGHYSNYSTNTYYDPSQSQWTSPSTNLPMKFESSHSSSPSRFDLSDGQEGIIREDPLNSISPIRHIHVSTPTPSSSSTSQLISIPPRNLLNGNQLTFFYAKKRKKRTANDERISQKGI